MTTQTQLQTPAPGLSVPAHVGVLGGGRMGAGIAHSFLAAGAQVTIVDVDESAAAAARDRVLRDTEGSLRRGAAGTVEEWLSRLHTATDAAAFAGLPLVVEAVPESMELKASSFARSEEGRVGKECRSRWSPYH